MSDPVSQIQLPPGVVVEEAITGAPPSDADLQWLALMEDARKTSLTVLNDMAKQLIGVSPILSGLYAATLTFSKIDVTYWHSHIYASYIFMAPIFFWLISLIAAVIAMFPQAYTYNNYSPDDAKKTYLKLVSTKHRYLIGSMIAMILSIAALLLAVSTYLDVLALGQTVKP